MVTERAGEVDSYKMNKLMQPFKVGEDVGLSLETFEEILCKV